jgi:Flp pilus assembly pilin Flp
MVGPVGGPRCLARDGSAVTAIEYALMGAMVALAIIGGINGYAGNLGTLMTSTFNSIATAI